MHLLFIYLSSYIILNYNKFELNSTNGTYHIFLMTIDDNIGKINC